MTPYIFIGLNDNQGFGWINGQSRFLPNLNDKRPRAIPYTHNYGIAVMKLMAAIYPKR